MRSRSPLKVFGYWGGGSARGIVAAASQRRAAELLGITLDALRQYGCETGNDTEVALCTANPEVVFGSPEGFPARYFRFAPSEDWWDLCRRPITDREPVAIGD